MNLEASFQDRKFGFVSGNEQDPWLEIEKARDAANELASGAKCDQAYELIQYLNSLPHDLFTCIHNRWSEAYSAISALPDEDEGTKKHQQGILRRVKIQPQPFYKPVNHSVRLYSHGPSILNVTHDIRDMLTCDWIKVDLKQAQLQTISKLWNAPSIREYLQECEVGFWNDLMIHMGIELTGKSKRAVKEATYSTIFGMYSKNVTKKLVNKHHIDEERASTFLKHPVIEFLFSARDTKIKSFKLKPTVKDAFGNVYDIRDWDKEKKWYDKATSILACQAQSYELAILFPVIEYAKTTESDVDPLYVTGFLHDGIWLHCEDKNKLRIHLDKVHELIKTESETLLGFSLEAESDTVD